MKYAVIGNSAAGVFAMEAIREIDKESNIIMFTDEPGPAYSRCLTTHYLADGVSEGQMLIRAEDFYRRHNIDTRFGTEVTGLDPVQGKIKCRDGHEVSFDRLLIASGASPVLPEIPGIQSEGVYTLRTIKDAKAIKQRALPGGRAVVLGAGPVGLKTAYALLLWGMQVTVVAGSPQILSQVMDHAGARLIQSHLEDNGMKFYLGYQVEEFFTSDKGAVSAVKLDDQTELPCSIVVVGKGIKPNTGFLGTEFNIKRGLVVDEYLETSRSGIFAAGDVAETFDIAGQDARVNATWPNAAAQGRVAGRNMAGCRERYTGSLALNSLEFSGLNAITAGVSRARGPEFEVLEALDGAARRYRRLVFKGDYLVGYVAVNDIEGVGALTARIRARIPVKNKQVLLRGRPLLAG